MRRNVLDFDKFLAQQESIKFENRKFLLQGVIIKQIHQN